MNLIRRPVGVFLALAAAVGFVLPAGAGMMPLNDDSGINSGWVAYWDDDRDVDLDVDLVDDDTLYLTKLAVFTEEPINAIFPPLSIRFERTREDAVPYIAINDDIVINQTGYPWIEFRFVLDGAARFDRERTAVGQESGFAIDPFTHFEYEDTNRSLIVSGGVIPPEPVGDNVWFAGAGPGALYIRAADVEVGASFVLDEIPVIPLPPAVWAGLVTLAGMGAVSKLSRRRRLV